MCGHVGVAGNITIREERIIKTLLILDSVRGIDGTGIAVIPKVGDVKLAKETGDPFNLFSHKQYDQSLMGTHRAIIGHNRWKTQGKISKHNSHPFEFDTLVGAHNGTLSNKFKLDDSAMFDVDSENLYHHINKNGLRDAMNIAQGAWALVWWDKLNESINFLRNSERPLWLTRTPNGSTLFWASEKWMLQVALSRENVTFDEPVLLQEDMHHSVGVDSKGDMQKLVVTPMAAKKTAPAPSSIPWQGSYTRPSAPVVSSPPVVSKNNGVVPVTTVNPTAPFNPGYAHSKNASLEVLGISSDKFGAGFYMCKDDTNPNANIRLYFNKKTGNGHNTGLRITADIGEYRVTVADGAYYKVVASSVRIIGEAAPKSTPALGEYKNSKGHYVDYNTWMNNHSTCSNCDGNVFPIEKYKFTRAGEVVCEFCADDRVIAMMCN